MAKVTIDKNDLIVLSGVLNDAKALVDRIKSQAVDNVSDTTDPPVIEHDAICYLKRYQDLKKSVEGKPREFKISWAREHYERHGRNENRIWGCIEEPIPTETPDAPDIRSAPDGILWKPVAESRNGVPALLTPKQWDRVDTIKLFPPTSDTPIRITRFEKRGRTNGNRETYFFHGIRA